MEIPGSRRRFLQTASAGFAHLAFAGLAAEAARRESPLIPRAPHHPPQVRRVIFLCMRGGPSHMETFDPKPLLTRDHGKPGRHPRSFLLGSRWQFRPSGESGLEIVELLPHLAAHADRLCVLRGMHTDNENHPQALQQLHTGSFQFTRPSIGSWLVYGLGTENRDLPGFVSINPLTNLGGLRYYQSAFLPTVCSATTLGNANRPSPNPAIGDLSNPRIAPRSQREQLDLIQSMNRGLAEGTPDPHVEGMIESCELAFRMQGELPRVMDLSGETQETLRLYGIDETASATFGRQCLLARRFAEAGVRFVEITHTEWDLHGFLTTGMTNNCRQTDRPIAGLLADLHRRGLLEDTLVLWGGEFGRTPDDPTTDGRGHNNRGFSMWLAGGGVRPGFVHGATDDYGYEAVEGRVHVHDLHATVLHLLGLDHERLTYRFGGRDFRLTDVHGRVVREILTA